MRSVVVALLALTLAACTDSGTVSQDSPVSGGGPGCKPDALKAEVKPQEGGKAVIALINAGSAECQLQGGPGLTFTTAEGRPLDVAVAKVEQPSAGPDIKLQPGQSAFAGLKWTVCDQVGPGCAVTAGIRIDLPAGGAVVAKWDGGAQPSVKAAQIGTLQPASEGVVAW